MRSETGKIDQRLVCLLRPDSMIAEQYNRLRHKLESMAQPDRAMVIGVTSPAEGDGKTLTAINLAGALAREDRGRVLLVDLDLRRSGTAIGKYLDLKDATGPGVTDWIQNSDLRKADISNGLEGFNIDFIPAGSNAESVYDLLKSPRLHELLEGARRHYRFIVVDSPHAEYMSDVELIAREVDGFLGVVKADHTSRQDLASMLSQMTKDKVLGLVFNQARTGR